MTPTDDPIVRPAPRTPPVVPGEPVAWRAPAATRFDGRPANDFLARADRIAPMTSRIQPEVEDLPRWVIFVIGAVVAALMGGLLGAVISI